MRISRSSAVSHYCRGWYKTLIFIVVAPSWAWCWASVFMVAVFWIFREQAAAAHRQTGSASCNYSRPPPTASVTAAMTRRKPWASSRAHSIRPVFMTQADIAGNWGHYHWPIILAAHAAIALGTYFGGWRIVHTMGLEHHQVEACGGFCAETAGAITLFGTALAGIPVSTTHTITGAIVGVGADQSPFGRPLGSRAAASSGPGFSPSRPPQWPQAQPSI